MRWMEWRLIGHVPGYCFQCREARSHELYEIDLLSRLALQTRRALYGLEMRCGCCGLRSAAEPSMSAVRSREQIVDPESAIRDAFGDDSYQSEMLARRRDADSGLLDSTGRLELLVRSWLAIGHHGELPSLGRSHRARRVPVAVKFLVGIAAAMGIGLAADMMFDVGTGAVFTVVLPMPVALWFIVWGSDEGRRTAQGRELKRAVVDMQERLLKTIRPLAPTGFELREAHKFVAERASVGALVDPEDTLLRLGRGTYAATEAVDTAA